MISFNSEHPCRTGRTGIIMIILKDGKTDTGWTQSKPALSKNFLLVVLKILVLLEVNVVTIILSFFRCGNWCSKMDIGKLKFTQVVSCRGRTWIQVPRLRLDCLNTICGIAWATSLFLSLCKAKITHHLWKLGKFSFSFCSSNRWASNPVLKTSAFPLSYITWKWSYNIFPNLGKWKLHIISRGSKILFSRVGPGWMN